MTRARRRLALLVAWLAVSACKAGHDPHPDPHDEPGEHDAHATPGPRGAQPADAGRTLVRVAPDRARDLRVTTRPAESRPSGDTAALLGELRLNEETYAEIGTSVPARVARVLAAPGDSVVAGQPLVELDSAEVGRARAAVLVTRAKHDLAKRTLARRQALEADGIVPRRDVEAAEAELQQAAAEGRAARAELSALGASRGSGPRFALASPIAGTVMERSALRGRLVDPTRPLFVIGDLSRLWLVVHAFERDALRLRVGASARVAFAALPGQVVTGKLTQIGRRVDPASRTVDVRIELENPEQLLRPGMSATAMVPVGDSEQRVVAVPVEALQRQPDGWCVFLPADEEGAFEVRAVARGRDLGGAVEVLSGLRAGERVVVEGAFLLRAEAERARGGGADEHGH
ncbi:MAG: efflux RND transporter periplasmic adaptor subunit [Polyangiaceae bacterium]|nr:efflux RND transporter periplasmic adaptor subunit [Polyangiaceae bacterium]